MTTNTETTDLRQERGRLLSQNKGIKHIAGVTWPVPSQTQSSGGYIVNTAEKTCSCPDYELRRCKCKHQWAVTFVQTIENHADGTQTVTESMTYSRITHQQDWPAYNEAQVSGAPALSADRSGRKPVLVIHVQRHTPRQLCAVVRWRLRPPRSVCARAGHRSFVRLPREALRKARVRSICHPEPRPRFSHRRHAAVARRSTRYPGSRCVSTRISVRLVSG